MPLDCSGDAGNAGGKSGHAFVQKVDESSPVL